MDGIILAENVIMLIEKEGNFHPFVCATDLSIQIDMETKQVRTDGDGKWKRSRGQVLSYKLNLSGVTVFNSTDPNTKDIIEYCRQMVHLNFRIVFEDPLTNLANYFIGRALPTSINLASSSSGFATGTFDMEGDGELEMIDSLVTCDAEIISAQVVNNTAEGAPPSSIVIRINDVSENTSRVEYSIDGGGREAIFSVAPDTVTNHTVTGSYPGAHTLVLYPICENGEDGIPYEIDFVR